MSLGTRRSERKGDVYESAVSSLGRLEKYIWRQKLTMQPALITANKPIHELTYARTHTHNVYDANQLALVLLLSACVLEWANKHQWCLCECICVCVCVCDQWPQSTFSIATSSRSISRPRASYPLAISCDHHRHHHRHHHHLPLFCHYIICLLFSIVTFTRVCETVVLLQ